MEEEPTFWESGNQPSDIYTTPEDDETLQNAPKNQTELANQQTSNVLSGAVEKVKDVSFFTDYITAKRLLHSFNTLH